MSEEDEFIKECRALADQMDLLVDGKTMLQIVCAICFLSNKVMNGVSKQDAVFFVSHLAKGLKLIVEGMELVGD